jgi:hypothetical protein
MIPENYIPLYAKEEAGRFKKEFLKKNSQAASDLQYRFFYDRKGRACLEYTVTPKSGYKWETTKWVGYTWGTGFGYIGNKTIKFTKTKKLLDEAQYRLDERRKDPVFNNIEKIVLKIAKEYNYDFEAAYGIKVKYRRPNVKRGVCYSYSDAVTTVFRQYSQVASVERWSSKIGNHAWNILVLNDGRKLYCDATWYGGNKIDDDGYVVDIPEQDPVNLTFDIAEFNSQGGAINCSTMKLLAVHFAWGDAKKQG